MTDMHPNIAVLQKFNPANPADAAEVFAEDAVWHYFNPELPDVQGDYVGPRGVQDFFGKMAGRTKGTFKVNPMSITPVGDELLVVHVKDTLTLENQQIETDAVVVWRIVEGQIREVWDIPSVFTAETKTLAGKDES